jgi:hypothetical protein
MNRNRHTLWPLVATAALTLILLPREARADAAADFLNCLKVCNQSTPSCSPARIGCTVRCFDAFLPLPRQPTKMLLSPASAVDPPPDTTPPTCTVPFPPTPSSMTVNVQDTGGGLQIILVVQNVNTNVVPPNFPVGTKDPVPVTAKKNDLSASARFQLAVFDVCLNFSQCDPVMTGVLRSAGKPVAESYPGLPREEGVVTIFNGSPGFSNLDIIVNGLRFKLTGLEDGAERSLDISSAMLPGSFNVVTLKGLGKPGSSAGVLIWDGGGQ